MLVQRTRFREGPHKLEDPWAKDIFQVVGKVQDVLSVYDVSGVQEVNQLGRLGGYSVTCCSL